MKRGINMFGTKRIADNVAKTAFIMPPKVNLAP
jgi:hypothetical protein